jgi:hypothetical protein
VNTVYGLIALASVFGGLGLAIGWLAGTGVVRFTRDRDRAARVVAAVLAVVVLGIGIQQTTAIRTVPKNNADARAHDYSLAELWVGLSVWVTAANAVGAVIGVHIPVRRYGRKAQRPPLPQAQPPLHLE